MKKENTACLEAYYNTRFKNRFPQDEMPDFQSLPDEHKSKLKKSYGFAAWELHREMTVFLNLLFSTLKGNK